MPDMASCFLILNRYRCSSFESRSIHTSLSVLSLRSRAKRISEESYNTLDVYITHYIIGLDVIGAGNEPGLHVCTWCCGGCGGKHIHIPGWDSPIRGALD